VRQGQTGSDLYLVLDGVIRVDRDGAQRAEYGPGAILGERAHLETGVRTSTLVAVTPCRVAAVPASQFGDRDDASVRLLMPAPADASSAEAALARGMSPPHFPITPRQLRGQWKFDGIEPGIVRLGTLTLLAGEIPHKGGRTFGYRVSDGVTSFAYLPDHSPTSLGLGPDGLGEHHDAALELADGADILMHDSFWYAQDFEPAETLGHAAAEYAIGLAVAAGARQVLLLHHRPDRTDSELEKLAAGLRVSPVPVALAADGEVICL